MLGATALQILQLVNLIAAVLAIVVAFAVLLR